MATITGANASDVPARTVIGWFPPPSALTRETDGSVTIRSPSGWAVCDGTKGTSDLSHRFIMAVKGDEKIGTSGGWGTHSQNAGGWPGGGWGIGGGVVGGDYGQGLAITLIRNMKR